MRAFESVKSSGPRETQIQKAPRGTLKKLVTTHKGERSKVPGGAGGVGPVPPLRRPGLALGGGLPDVALFGYNTNIPPRAPRARSL